MNKSNVIVIPKEKTVFWMDGNGRWQNEFGRFEKKKIIDYFHSAIDRDEDGYFVKQDKGGIIEKAYFRYEDTALFVFHVNFNDSIELILNTSRRITLQPEKLWIEMDNLYMSHEGERIKFTDRTMMKIATIMEDRDDECFIRVQGNLYLIPEYMHRQ